LAHALQRKLTPRGRILSHEFSIKIRFCKLRAGAERANAFNTEAMKLGVMGVTITVTAHSREQLDELYRTWSTHPMVRVVL
jgi:hypothetical protein